MRNVDDAPQPNWSDIDYSHQLSFTTGPFPETPWSTSIVDFCRPTESCWGHAARDNPRFDFDAAGNPAVFFTENGVGELASWKGNGWQLEALPQSVAIDSSNWAYDFAFDPTNGQATIASAVPGIRTALKFYRRTGATPPPGQPKPWRPVTFARIPPLQPDDSDSHNRLHRRKGKQLSSTATGRAWWEFLG